MKENNKGITLIALIITIIVLLILVAITVDVAVDGKLFDKTEEAVSKTNNKEGQLQNGVDYLMGKLGEEGSCIHEYGEWEITKEATCTETGSKERTCTKCGHRETEVIPNTGHTFTDGRCEECGESEYDNSIPIISTVTLNTKTINSFTINVLATDADEENLIYNLYVEGINGIVDTKTVAQNTTVELTANNLEMYTDYNYYVIVSDDLSNVQSDTATVKTKCNGQTITCTTSECTAGTTTTCSKCKGKGRIKCTTCGGDGVSSCKVCVLRREFAGVLRMEHVQAVNGTNDAFGQSVTMRCSSCKQTLSFFWCNACVGDYYVHDSPCDASRLCERICFLWLLQFWILVYLLFTLSSSCTQIL